MRDTIKFWKEHSGLRTGLMLVFFAAGLALVIFGWKQTGKLWGLGVMVIGLALLLVTLWLYNIVFTDPKEKGKRESKK